MLGLLTGGILTGQNLIRSAELRSMMSQFESINTSVMVFKNKYFAIPGDMTNATDFWGRASGTPCVDGQSTDSTVTCNGNGDGQLYSTYYDAESFLFWKHLSNAGLIEGSYTGYANGHGHTPGVSLPRTAIGGVSFDIGWTGVVRHRRLYLRR